ncbi:MAG: hypothetical protein OEW39_06570 [Deltaproteobacteria bacterium]|nr:hypothetical protein [Deltaproteobacteria bacterium]
MSMNFAIMGKGGTGKTFIAAHLATALAQTGLRTLLVGCDQKQDARRHLTREPISCLMDELRVRNFVHDELPLEAVVVAVTDHLHVMELGASPLLAGSYANVLEEAFQTFDALDLWKTYECILFDITEERFDGSHTSVFRRVERGLVVMDESAESMFITNRLMRAALIGGHELKTRLKLIGLINNRSSHPERFLHFAETTRLFPLLTIPVLPGVSALKSRHETLFTVETRSPQAEVVRQGFVTLSNLVRGVNPSIFPLNTLFDEDVWRLAGNPPE